MRSVSSSEGLICEVSLGAEYLGEKVLSRWGARSLEKLLSRWGGRSLEKVFSRWGGRSLEKLFSRSTLRGASLEKVLSGLPALSFLGALLRLNFRPEGLPTLGLVRKDFFCGFSLIVMISLIFKFCQLLLIFPAVVV